MKVPLTREQRIRVLTGVKKGRKEKAIEIARALKKKGIDPKLIAEVASKLSINQIRKL